MIMVANSSSSIQEDKQKLKAQVQHLCSENDRLRELAHSPSNIRKVQMDSNSFMDNGAQGGERIDGKKINSWCV